MNLFGKFATVGGATMMSRLLGFAREVLIASSLGAGPAADAFFAAFRFPNLFRRLLAEGAFNSAFIPLFAKELEGNGRLGAKRFAEDVLSVLIVVLIILMIVAELSMPWLVGHVVAPRFADTPDKFALTIELTRVMFPYLVAMSLVAMLSGVLNAFRKYFLAAFVPVVLNVILIGVLFLALYVRAEPFTTARFLAWGVFVAGFAQLAFLIVGVKRSGFALRLRIPRVTPAVVRLLVLAGPVAVTAGITQINLLIGQIIASAQDGAIALLSYADRIYQLPLGVIGIAVGVVLLPELSRALKASDDSSQEAARLQNGALEFSLGLTAPASVGLALLPVPIVNVLFERGAFSADTTTLTAAAVVAFAFGLPSFVLIKVFTPGFFAREDMRTPMWFAAISVCANIAVSLLLFPNYGHVGIAIATSIAGWLNAVLLAAALWWRGHFRPGAQVLRRIALILVASALMGAVLHFGKGHFATWLQAPELFVRGGAVAILVFAGAALYFSLIVLTGAVDRAQLRRIVRRS